MIDAFCPCPMCTHNRMALRVWGRQPVTASTVDQLIHDQPHEKDIPRAGQRAREAALTAALRLAAARR